MPVRGSAKPGDLRELRVGGPEALCAGRPQAGVFKVAGDSIAVLQVDGSGLGVQIAAARAAAIAGNQTGIGGDRLLNVETTLIARMGNNIRFDSQSMRA